MTTIITGSAELLALADECDELARNCRYETPFRRVLLDSANALRLAAKPDEDGVRKILIALEPFTKLGGGQNPRDAKAGLYFAAYYDLPGDTIVYENSGAYITADDVRTARRVFSAFSTTGELKPKTSIPWIDAEEGDMS